MWFFKEQKTESSLRQRGLMLAQESHKDTWSIIFLICINDLADELSSNTKLFNDDTFLSSVVHNGDSSAAELNNNVAKINHWVSKDSLPL